MFKTLLYIILFLPVLLWAQYPSGTNSPRTGNQTSDWPTIEEDTFSNTIHYFSPNNPNIETPWTDTTMNSIQQFEPIRKQKWDFASLGNLGSAHRPLVYQPDFRKGLDIGLHQYDLYYVQPENLNYYNVAKPFSDLFFSQGATKEDLYFKAKFTKNFSKNLNFSLDHRKINQKGQYNHQKSLNNAFGIGLWYHSPDNRYDAFLSFHSNVTEQEDNGGNIVDTSLFSKTTLPIGRPVNTSTAQTRHQHRTYYYHHYYKLRNDKDTSGTAQRAITISHSSRWQKSIYKFYDSNKTTTYYEPFLTNNRGVRRFFKANKLENTFALSTFKPLDKNKKFKQQRDLLELGMTHTLHQLDFEAADSTLHNLFLFGRWNFTPSEKLQLKTYAHFGILSNRGDYRLSGDLKIGTNQLGELNITFINQLYEPTLMQQKMYINHRVEWQNDFKKILETSVAVTYNLPSIRTEISGQYHLLDNYVYFDTLVSPQQKNAPISILQLLIKNKIQFGILHINNAVALQTNSGTDVLRLPKIYSKHTVFIQGKLFRKRLATQAGLDLRTNNAYFADNYHPLTGQFFLQNDNKILSYPLLDFFLNFRVESFRFFFKIENITNWMRQDIYFQTATYGWPDAAIRFAIAWQLRN